MTPIEPFAIGFLIPFAVAFDVMGLWVLDENKLLDTGHCTNLSQHLDERGIVFLFRGIALVVFAPIAATLWLSHTALNGLYQIHPLQWLIATKHQRNT